MVDRTEVRTYQRILSNHEIQVLKAMTDEIGCSSKDQKSITERKVLIIVS